MKSIKKLSISLLSVVMLIGLQFTNIGFNLIVSSKASKLPSNGQCGSYAFYTFDESTGLLTISGFWGMEDYDNGESPFYNINSIKSVIIENGITSIGSNAFEHCRNLSSIIIPEGVTQIGTEAFCLCTSLTSIKIPDSVIAIGGGAFSNCKGLSSINIPNGVTSISYETFDACESLASITIPNSVTEIEAAAFEDCVSLISVTIPDSVTKIREFAFSGCKNLRSITISNSITAISESVFSCCESLTSVTIPNSVTNIEYAAFAGCSNLTSITIPDSVIEIVGNAFFACPALSDVYFMGSEQDWEKIYVQIGNEPLLNATIHYYSNGTESISDFKSGIKIIFPIKTFAEKPTLKIETITSDSILDIIQHQDNVIKSCVFSIETIIKGKVVQPSEVVTVKIPIPTGFEAEKCKIYYIDSQKNATTVDSMVDSGFIVFETNHFSDWAVVETNDTERIIPTINLSADSVTVKVGQTTEIARSIYNPDKVSVDVKYGIKDKSVATVTVNNGNYIITGIKAGSTVLQVIVYEKGTTNLLSKKEILVTVENIGKVKSVSIGNMELTYRDSIKLNPKIEMDGNIKYRVKYKSSNPKVATVDDNGNVKGVKSWGKKTATITCTVTDEYGNQISDTCNVTVGYAWWQWIIGIVLFGWIWY